MKEPGDTVPDANASLEELHAWAARSGAAGAPQGAADTSRPNATPRAGSARFDGAPYGGGGPDDSFAGPTAEVRDIGEALRPGGRVGGDSRGATGSKTGSNAEPYKRDDRSRADRTVVDTWLLRAGLVLVGAVGVYIAVAMLASLLMFVAGAAAVAVLVLLAFKFGRSRGR